MRRDFGCVEKQKHKNEAKAVGEYRKNNPTPKEFTRMNGKKASTCSNKTY